MCVVFFFFQAEDGIRDAQESRGLGDVYKRQAENTCWGCTAMIKLPKVPLPNAKGTAPLLPVGMLLSLIHI